MKKSIFLKIKEAAEKIVNEKGKDAIINTSDIKSKLKDTKSTSILLSDYCYNRTNKGIDFEWHNHIFEYVGKDEYRYLGEGYQYTGNVYHKPIRQKDEIIVGCWNLGQYISKQRLYIEEKGKEFAKNIDDFLEGQTVQDIDGSQCTIIDKTSNSILVNLKSKSNEGVDCTQWFDMANFNKRFSKIQNHSK